MIFPKLLCQTKKRYILPEGGVLMKTARWLTFIVIIFFGGVLFSQSATLHGKVLILGFNSDQINETQDMLLRNYLMRAFMKKGYSTVPIMALEEFVLEKSFNVRQTTRNDLKRLCAYFHADFALSGSIETRRKKLFVSVSLYQKESEQYYSFIIPMGRASEFQTYCPALARDIAEKADTLIKGNKK